MGFPRGIYRDLALIMLPLLIWFGVGWLLFPYAYSFVGYALQDQSIVVSYLMAESSFGFAAVCLAYWWTTRTREVIIHRKALACPGCGRRRIGEPVFCPYCGFDFEKKEGNPQVGDL